MRIACPSCAAEYEVPTARLKPGKLVRCAKCGESWLPELEPEDVEPPLDPPHEQPAEPAFEPVLALPDITAMDRLAASPAPRPWRTGLIGAWLLTFIALAGAAAAAVGWRDTLIRAWPPGGRIIAATTAPVPQPAQPPAKKPE